MPDAEIVLFTILGFFGGLGLIIWGFISFKHYQLLRDTPTSKIQSLSVGTVEVTGTAKPHTEEPMYSHPITDDDVLYYSLEIEEHQEDDDGSDWHTVKTDASGVRFVVDDGTGQVDVLVNSPQFEFTDSDVQQEKYIIGPDKEVPPVLEEFDDGDSSFIPDFLENEKYRVTVKSIEPEQEVFIFGEAEIRDNIESATNEDNLLLSNPTEDASLGSPSLDNQGSTAFDHYRTPFIISTQSEAELQQDFKWSGPGGFVGGLALSAICLYFLLNWFFV